MVLLTGSGFLACTSPVPKTPPAPAAVTASTPPLLPPEPVDLMARARPVMDLLAILAKFDRDGRDPAQRIGFELPETAINDYLAYSLHVKPRPGIGAARVSLLPKNQVALEVEIDFDSIVQWHSWTPPDFLRSLLSGKQTVRLNAEFAVNNGRAIIYWKDVQGPGGSALLNNVAAGLLQAIGLHQPESYDTTQPIPLPFGLKRIWTEKQLMGGET